MASVMEGWENLQRIVLVPPPDYNLEARIPLFST